MIKQVDSLVQIKVQRINLFFMMLQMIFSSQTTWGSRLQYRPLFLFARTGQKSYQVDLPVISVRFPSLYGVLDALYLSL